MSTSQPVTSTSHWPALWAVLLHSSVAASVAPKTFVPYASIIGLAAGLILVLWAARLFRKHLTQMQNLNQDLLAKTHENELLQKEITELSCADPSSRRGGSQFLSYLMAREENRIEREYNNWISGKTFAPVNMDLIFMVLKLECKEKFHDLTKLNDCFINHARMIMRQCVRDSDVLIRWEESGFLFVFRQANRDSAPFLAERLRWGISQEPLALDEDSQIHATCTIGFACYPFFKRAPSSMDWEQVVRVAEAAQNHCVTHGKGWVGFNASKNCEPGDGLVERLLRDSEAMIEAEELHVLYSGSQPRETIETAAGST